MKGWIAVTLVRRGELLDTKPDTLRIANFGVCTRSLKTCFSPEPRAALSFIRVAGVESPDQYGRIVPLADTFPSFPASPWLYPLEAYHYEPTGGVLLVERPTDRFPLRSGFPPGASLGFCAALLSSPGATLNSTGLQSFRYFFARVKWIGCSSAAILHTPFVWHHVSDFWL